MIEEGATAPDFTIPGTEGQEIERYGLEELTTEGAAVLVFYPFDFSSVCTEVLCNFRDAEWLSFTDDIDVLGVSRDSCYAHMEFIQEYDLPFPLLSDTEGRVIREYGVTYDEWELHEGVPKRALVTIDDEQTVRYTWETEDAYESPTLGELHQAVKALEEENLG